MPVARTLLVLTALAWPAAAAAQSIAGPFGGLFGRTPERTGREFTALDFRSAVGAQYDDAILDDATPPNVAPVSGSTAGANAGLTFERRRDRLRFNLRGGGTYQEFVREPSISAVSYDAGGLMVARVATRLSLDASATYVRTPFYRLLPGYAGSVIPTPIPVPGEPFAARRLTTDTLQGSVGFTSPYTRRSTFSASVSHRQTRFPENRLNDLEGWAGHARWTRKMNRDLSARAGYAREEVQLSADAEGRFVHEMVDLGVDFLRELSVARRTSLSFDTQTSIIRHSGGERRYRLNGGAALVQGFRRTWIGSMQVRRNTEFLPGFLAPVFTDQAGIGLAGMLGSRIEWSSSAGASRGEFGFDADAGEFKTYSGAARLAAGLTRHLGVYVQYSYYKYDIPSGASGLVVLPQLSRQAVTAGLSTWIPIFTRVREPRDPG